MRVRAKFYVTKIVQFPPNAGCEVSLQPVSSGSKENEAFWEATPSGSMVIHITNPSAQTFFKAGAEYYLDFIPAEGGNSQVEQEA